MKKITSKTAFYYRSFAFIFSVWGIVSHIKLFDSSPRLQGLMTYTVQSNILVCIVFGILACKTYKKMNSSDNDGVYSFIPGLSFAAMIDIILTMLIFWVVLAPTNWAGLTLFSADNLAVHLFTPLLIITDRILFYKGCNMPVKNILSATVFPYVYVIEAYINGKLKLVMFGEVSGGSYYLYPFLNFDRLGWGVLVYIALLTVFFLIIGFLFYRWENK